MRILALTTLRDAFSLVQRRWLNERYAQAWSCLDWARPKNTDSGTGRIGNVSMIREGDKFKDGRSGKVFTVTKIHADRIMLEAEDGSFQSVIIPESMPSSGRNAKRQRKPLIEANSN